MDGLSPAVGLLEEKEIQDFEQSHVAGEDGVAIEKGLSLHRGEGEGLP